MTIDQWIAAASSLATVIAAFLAALSIAELKRQNAAAYRPIITIARTNFAVAISPKTLFWTRDGEDDEQVRRNFGIALLNVGNGIATNLSVRWCYEVNTWIQACIEDDPTAEPLPIFSLDGDWIKITGMGKMQAAVRTAASTLANFDFLAPVTTQIAGPTVQVDHALQSLLAVHYTRLFALMARDKGRKISFEPPSEITLSITYQDALKHKYAVTIPIKLSLAMWQPATSDDVGKAHLIVEHDYGLPSDGFSVSEARLPALPVRWVWQRLGLRRRSSS